MAYLLKISTLFSTAALATSRTLCRFGPLVSIAQTITLREHFSPNSYPIFAIARIRSTWPRDPYRKARPFHHRDTPRAMSGHQSPLLRGCETPPTYIPSPPRPCPPAMRGRIIHARTSAP